MKLKEPLIFFYLIPNLVFAFCVVEEVYADESTRIGVVLPLTGGGAFWGTNSRDAIELAVEDMNKNGVDVTAAYNDDHCDPKTAVSVFHQLTEVEKVKFILGPICSSAVLAIAPLAERTKTLVLTPCAEAADISQAGDYIFRLWSSNGKQAHTLARYAIDVMNIKKMAILAIQNDYGAALASAFKQEFEKRGGKITALIEYAQDVTSLKSELIRAKGSKPEGIFAASYTSDAAMLVKEAHTLNMNLQIFGSSNMAASDFLKNTGTLANGIIVSDLGELTDKEFQERFAKRFKKQWPGMSSCASVAYDSARLLAEAIGAVGDDPSKVKDYFYQMKGYAGVSGPPVQFDSNGDVIREHRIFKIHDGRLLIQDF